MNIVIVIGLAGLLMIGYSRIFRNRNTIHEESKTSGHLSLKEEKQKLIETRMAQVGVALLGVGFGIQIKATYQANDRPSGK